MNLQETKLMTMNRIHSLTTFLFLALCACGCGLLPSMEESPKMEETSTGVYDVDIPAVMDDLPIKFKATDKVYLYNDTQKAFACDQNGTATVLHPEEIGKDGTSCVLKGQVSFYKYSYETEKRTLLSVGENDVFLLLYNPSEVDTENPEASSYNYEDQTGTKDSALAHYYAESLEFRMNASGGTIRFYGVQSLLSASLSFKKGGAAVQPNLVRLTVTSEHGAIAKFIRAVTGEVWTDKITLRNPNATELSLALATGPQDEPDRMVLQALDAEGNFYDAFVEIPFGGLKPGAGYESQIIFDYSMSLKTPAVTRSDGGAEEELAPDADNTYKINPRGGKIAIRIDGDCTGYNFVLQGRSTVTLGGEGTAYYPFEGGFLAALFYDLDVVLDSDYTVKCPYWLNCIMADAAQLKLSTTGGTYKLTVTCQIDEDYNLKGLSARNYSVFSDQDPAGLAGEGFTVTLSSEKNNGDGTGTYVYTVAPAN